MSFARFWESDIYIYEHVGGFIECCGCSLAKEEDGGAFGFGFTHLKTPREALAHLDVHETAGDDIGRARHRIENEYKDLDAPIQPYAEDAEVTIRRRERLREMFKSMEKFPSEKFRDAGNSE